MGDAPKRRLRRGAVAAATTAQLHALGVDPASHALAAVALRLAAEVDSSPDPKATATAARELRQAMAVVVAAAPPRERGDKVDEIAKRRERRLSPQADEGTG
ncbi:hypothetical protein PYK79_53830 [Streptomyces sp. ID05-04B]|uniref:hypothetical protein n=1 Tax=unclassified Streptomyces TaxID=2593676 RepID=UPI000D1A4926|nr:MULTISPECIES: hypothetical protein [unclassified Streptomyces]AVV46453.1 hypothetical protein C6376_38950 [Streptomyces sp. P3]AVV46512.1 hypothetical protein C6376_39250 [Streptomyces sp. P3]MDX5570395.1 hypothetical protein [Streptomyces sp. ID05-04B]